MNNLVGWIVIFFFRRAPLRAGGEVVRSAYRVGGCFKCFDGALEGETTAETVDDELSRLAREREELRNEIHPGGFVS